MHTIIYTISDDNIRDRHIIDDMNSERYLKYIGLSEKDFTHKEMLNRMPEKTITWYGRIGIAK